MPEVGAAPPAIADPSPVTAVPSPNRAASSLVIGGGSTQGATAARRRVHQPRRPPRSSRIRSNDTRALRSGRSSSKRRVPSSLVELEKFQSPTASSIQPRRVR